MMSYQSRLEVAQPLPRMVDTRPKHEIFVWFHWVCSVLKWGSFEGWIGHHRNDLLKSDQKSNPDEGRRHSKYSQQKKNSIQKTKSPAHVRQDQTHGTIDRPDWVREYICIVKQLSIRSTIQIIWWALGCVCVCGDLHWNWSSEALSHTHG